MNPKLQISKRLYLLLFCFFSFFSHHLIAQFSVKSLNPPSINTIAARCSDSLGNLYVVTNNFDTIVVSKLTVSTNQWSIYTVLPNTNNSVALHQIHTCDFYHGNLYISGYNASLNYSKIDIWEFSAGKWSRKARMNNSVNYDGNYAEIASIKYNNQLYYAGNFDSVQGKSIKNVVAFDGSVFRPAWTLSLIGLYKPRFAVNSDSLFLSDRSSVYLLTASNSWVKYYTPKFFNPILSLAVHNSFLYVGTNNEIHMVKNGTKRDSVKIPTNNANTLVTFNKKVFLATSRLDTNSAVYYIDNLKKLNLIFKNKGLDSTFYFQGDTGYISLFASQNHLYYHGSIGIKIGSTKYNYIIEIKDSIIPVVYDTIKGYVFWDKNNNYIKDGNDEWPISGWVRNVNAHYSLPLGKNNGSFEDIIDQNILAEYKIVEAVYDSCLKTQYSGNIQSINKLPGVTRDTVYLPLSNPSRSSLNLVVENQSAIRARLSDSISLNINIRNTTCNTGVLNNGVLTVTLDSSTQFLRSVPNYTSKNGNTYTFTNLKIDYSISNNILIKVNYPNSKYKINDKVRHHVRLGKIVGEDSANNMDSIVQNLVYSYDPNVKHSLPEGKITKELKSIRYYIDFQNLGNDYAQTVRVVDTLNTKMPVYEFKMIAASHPYKVSIQPGTGIVTWVFENINLKPKSQNEEASKGYIIFDAKVKGELRVGDSITNKASIYFDYNEPVITNYAVISMVKITPPIDGLAKINLLANTLKIYPNPASEYIKIENADLKSQILTIFDLSGKKVKTITVPRDETIQVSTTDWSKGLYLILSNNGESFKLMKE